MKSHQESSKAEGHSTQSSSTDSKSLQGSAIYRVIAVVVILVIMSSVIGYKYFTDSYQQTLSLSERQLLTVKPGQSFNYLCRQFRQNNWIENCWAHKLIGKITPNKLEVRVGSYWLNPEESINAVLARIQRGDEAQFSFTIIEGDNAYQVLDKMSRTPHLVFDDKLDSKDLAVTAEVLGWPIKSIEGYLAPDTYFFTNNMKASELLYQAYQTQKSRLKEAWEQRDRNIPIQSEYDLLTMASIIEKESSVNGERSRIASVFYNRLNKRMRLQTDPTVIYGVWHEYQGDIKRVHLRTKTPYNTYRVNGLPPTPIANPSTQSLMAAAQPETSDYFYFVASGQGGHTFSKTLSEHNQAVRAYLKQQESKTEQHNKGSNESR